MAWLSYSSGEWPYNFVCKYGEPSKATHFEGVDGLSLAHGVMLLVSVCLFLSSDTGKYKLSNSAGNLLLLLKTIFFVSEVRRCKWFSFMRYPFKSEILKDSKRRREEKLKCTFLRRGSSITKMWQHPRLGAFKYNLSRQEAKETDRLCVNTSNIIFPYPPLMPTN